MKCPVAAWLSADNAISKHSILRWTDITECSSDPDGTLSLLLSLCSHLQMLDVSARHGTCGWQDLELKLRRVLSVLQICSFNDFQVDRKQVLLLDQ